METDSITWGALYTFQASGSSALDGSVPFLFDETWSAAARVCTEQVGGPTFADYPLTLTPEGGFSATVDTSEAPWTEGEYYYDIRITDASGVDYWSQPIKLILTPRCTPPSA